MTMTGRLSRKELSLMLEKKQNKELVAFADEAKRKLLSDWTGGNGDLVRKELRLNSVSLSYAEQLLKDEDESRYAALKLGTLLGAIESLEKMQYEENQAVWAEADFTQEPVKHLPQVIQALETHGSMSHSALSAYLKMNAPTLTEAMKNILKTGAVQKSRIGKYKIYTLSDLGLRYGKELRKKKRLDQTLDEVCRSIRLLLQGAENNEERNMIETQIQNELCENKEDATRVLEISFGGAGIKYKVPVIDKGSVEALVPVNNIPYQRFRKNRKGISEGRKKTFAVSNDSVYTKNLPDSKPYSNAAYSLVRFT